jgi:hypothetical protein
MAFNPVLGVKCHGKDRGTHAFKAYRNVEEIAQTQPSSSVSRWLS